DTALSADAGRRDAVVLVIEDQAAIRRGMETLLGEWGYRPLLARNAEEALSHARTAAPDFIVSDYQLGNGATCLEAIDAVNAACGRTVPAVIVTGDTGPESLRAAIASGHVVLHKPLMPAKLRAVLMRMLPAE
ncbi:MAG TPA: response regulator, partial [bacterium]